MCFYTLERTFTLLVSHYYKFDFLKLKLKSHKLTVYGQEESKTWLITL